MIHGQPRASGFAPVSRRPVVGRCCGCHQLQWSRRSRSVRFQWILQGCRWKACRGLGGLNQWVYAGFSSDSAGSKTFWRSISSSPPCHGRLYNLARPPSILPFSLFLLHVDNTSVCYPLPGSTRLANNVSQRRQIANNPLQKNHFYSIRPVLLAFKKAAEPTLVDERISSTP